MHGHYQVGYEDGGCRNELKGSGGVQAVDTEEIQKEMQRMKDNQIANFEGMRIFMIEMKSLIMEAITDGNEQNEFRFIQIQEVLVVVQKFVEALRGKWDIRHQNDTNASMEEGGILQPEVFQCRHQE